VRDGAFHHEAGRALVFALTPQKAFSYGRGKMYTATRYRFWRPSVRLNLDISEAWRSAFPSAHAGTLVMREVANPAVHAGLESRKRELEQQLRAQFAGGDRQTIAAQPSIRAYDSYYRPFRKTYHVQHQLESVAFKGKPIPSAAALVEAMFMAELKSQLLTAGHDLDALRPPVVLSVAKGSERYIVLRGEEQLLKAGDMFVADQDGVISSIVYGPDQRTRLTAATRNAMFTVYAPAGISLQAVQEHLQELRDHILVISPRAYVEALQVL
jgi:DNA/RNA-binding domain of Phe-tRNA-synthetase-like protein